MSQFPRAIFFSWFVYVLVPGQLWAPSALAAATGSDAEASGQEVAEVAGERNERDPWEGFNRAIFSFNDTVDRYFLKPVAKGYRWVLPQFMEDGVSNMFSNVGEVGTIANDLLQFKFIQAGQDTGRFVLNSTVGLVGFFDVASKMGLERNDEDFGQTLGYWGVDAGPYVVLPFLGPRTVRDTAGWGVDTYTDPITYVDHVRTRNTLVGTRLVSDRAELLDAEQLISGDRYIFVRDAYLQRREFLVNDGQVEDDFGDENFDDMDSWDEDL